MKWCIQSAESWLNEAMMSGLDPDPLFKIPVTIKKIDFAQNVEKIQFEIKPTIPSNDPLLNKKMLGLLRLLDKYKINYIEVIGNRQRKINAVYVNAMEIYNIFATYFGSKSQAIIKFKSELHFEILKVVYSSKIENDIFNQLKKQVVIEGYWKKEFYGDAVAYDIKFNERTIEEFKEYFREKGFSFNENNLSLTLKCDENSYNQLLTIFQNFQQQCLRPRAQSHVEEGKNDRRLPKQRLAKPIDASTNPLQAPAQNEQPEKILRWRDARGNDISSTDANVYMILGTKQYDNPIYVTHRLAEDQFHSPYTFERVCEQIALARFAAKQGQPGLFIRADQQRLEVKVLGRHGQGDVRCYAEGFLTAIDENSHLYIVTDVDIHAHN